MTLSDIASIGSLVSGGAVLVSLLYLAQQIRQDSKHTRALIQQGRLARVVDSTLRQADADLAAAWLLANGVEPTPAAIKQRQFWLQCGATILGWDDTLAQHDEGLVSDEQFKRFCIQTIVVMRMSPALRAFLREPLADMSGDRLFQFIGRMLEEAESPPGP